MTSSRYVQIVVLGLTGILLAGCDNDAASYQIDGREHAVTLLRQQPYFWSKKTELAVVIARLPDCQRRHPLKPAVDGDPRAELFEHAPGQLLLRRGTEWYALETQNCVLQAVAAPQGSASARPLGAFDKTAGKLRFIAASTVPKPR